MKLLSTVIAVLILNLALFSGMAQAHRVMLPPPPPAGAAEALAEAKSIIVYSLDSSVLRTAPNKNYYEFKILKEAIIDTSKAAPLIKELNKILLTDHTDPDARFCGCRPLLGVKVTSEEHHIFDYVVGANNCHAVVVDENKHTTWQTNFTVDMEAINRWLRKMHLPLPRTLSPAK